MFLVAGIVSVAGFALSCRAVCDCGQSRHSNQDNLVAFTARGDASDNDGMVRHSSAAMVPITGTKHMYDEVVDLSYHPTKFDPTEIRLELRRIFFNFFFTDLPPMFAETSLDDSLAEATKSKQSKEDGSYQRFH